MENKFILILSLILAIAMIMVPASAANDNKDLTQGQPFLDVWEALTSGLSDLQDNIDAEEAARIAETISMQKKLQELLLMIHYKTISMQKKLQELLLMIHYKTTSMQKKLQELQLTIHYKTTSMAWTMDAQ
jgi:hypothetical protein